MLISENTYEKIMGLVTMSFQMNSFCDNIAYNIDVANYADISDIFHHSMAHKFPEFSDMITEVLAKLDVRAIRGGLHEDMQDYAGNLSAMFGDLAMECGKYRQAIIDAIDLAEYEGDYELKIFLEEFLMTFMPYYKQARVWKEYADRYQGDYKSFNIHFADITTYIPIVK